MSYSILKTLVIYGRLFTRIISEPVIAFCFGMLFSAYLITDAIISLGSLSVACQ